MVSKDEVVNLMICPVCKGDIDGDLVCKSCKRHWKSDDGIPIMMDKL